LNYALVGYGKMGRSIQTEADKRGHRLVKIVDPEIDGGEGLEQLSSSSDIDVAFEFTSPAAAVKNLSVLLKSGISTVCGTTGWTIDAGFEQVIHASAAGLILAPNFSVGMNLFYRLVEQAGKVFGAAGLHEPFVMEEHHRAKRDIPSGTARKLADILIEADPQLTSVHEGNPEEPLPRDTLHVSSVRCGAEAGTHTVGFDGECDRILLKHSSRGRAGFALGAVLAGEWIQQRRGRHGFDEVLEDLLTKT
jgi:4-hydroxy-tetrahydrodipicolinate reductase